jgi:3-deoxy-D-manno-octulosonic acid kinase
MLYDGSRAGNAGAAIFQPDYWRERGRVSRPPAGRGAALFVEDGALRWVLRHYRRGGLMARLSRDRYLWTGENRTRPFREWRLLYELHRQGFSVPAPVAARYRREGLGYTGELITERIPGARPLSVLLQSQSLPAHTWEAVGRCIRRFHAAGVFHADLNAHNILLDDAGAVFLIDFDRGRRRVPGAWTTQNLQRLQRSLNKINQGLLAEGSTSADWEALLRGYAQGPQ